MFLSAICIAAPIAIFSTNTDPCFSEIGIDEICQAATTRIERCNYNPPFKTAKVTKLHLLAWYREKDDRSVYVDCALVWAEANTDAGQRWFIVQMARNPMNSKPKILQRWHLYWVDDGDDGIVLFSAPPDSQTVQKSISNFRFKQDSNWVRYASYFDRQLWQKLIGDPVPAL